MGKVGSIAIPGIECFFYSAEPGHRPHFHAKRAGEWEIRVFFMEEPPEYEVKFAIRRIPGNKRRRLLDLAAEHRRALFEEWSRKAWSDE